MDDARLALVSVDLPWKTMPRLTRYGLAPTFPRGRVCEHTGCVTVLSIYDDGGTGPQVRCFVHQAPRYRRIRGKKQAAA